MKKRRMVLWCLGLLLILPTAYFCADLYFFARRPADRTHGRGKIIFHIAPGEPFRQVAAHLHRRSIIASELKFRILARFQKADRKIIAGEYELTGAMPPLAVLKTLTDGSVRLHRLSIPEGLTLRQTAEKVSAAGLCDPEAFMAAAEDESLVRRMGLRAGTFEGFLFPDTYYFSGDVSPEQIIKAMTDRFQEVFLPEWKIRAGDMGFSVEEIVALASMIEKETAVPDERALVSSVFHNRLKKKIRLASDPTVIYGIENFNGNLTRKDLTTTTPYNTYMITGLPLGPIASPGAASLHAALFPADTEYLFFVSKNDGTHQFSITLEDHNSAVEKYQGQRN